MQQSVTDRLVKTRVKGILNFTPARLKSHHSINVHHIDLAVELQSFVYFIKHYSNESEDTEEVEENEKTRI